MENEKIINETLDYLSGKMDGYIETLKKENIYYNERTNALQRYVATREIYDLIIRLLRRG